MTKELASKQDIDVLKADIALVKAEIKDEFHLEIANVNARIDKQISLW